MKNPYEILGISVDSTDAQVKSAYRNLAKKYHPDNYADSPLSDVASEKMKEINEAYDSIMNTRRKKGSSSGNQYQHGDYKYESKYPDIRNMIIGGYISEAQQMLDKVPQELRNAEWYFLQGTVFYKRGWLEQAYVYFMKAYNMEPSNGEFKAAIERMNIQRSGGNRSNSKHMNTSMGCNICDVCTSLICMDCCCECMGGDFIRCC